MKKGIINLLKIIAAGIIPIVLFVVVFTKPNITQGINTILTSDLNGQYVNLMTYFRNALLDGENIFYSFSGLLGIDTIGLLGYYLLSPFNLLILLFPVAKITKAIYIIIALKVMCAGIFSFIYFGRKNNYNLKMLILSTTYALSGYVFAYFMNLMWLDGVYMLPLVAIGLERLYEKNKTVMYTLFLALSFVLCYYTGYMIAGFALLYFSYLVFSVNREKGEIIRKYIIFMGASVSAALLSGIVLIPVIFAQLGSRGTTSSELGFNSITGLFSRLFTGVFSGTEFAQGSPHIYCGILILFFCILYFMPQKEKRDRRKLLVGGILCGAFILSFLIDILDVVWHIFSPPNSFTHRYAFVFIFVVLIFVKELFDNGIDKITCAGIIFTDVIIGALYCIVLYSNFESVEEIYLNLDMILLLVVSVILFIGTIKFSKLLKPLFVGIFILQCCMLVLNGRKQVSVFTFDDHSLEGYYNALKPVIEKVEENDEGLYRMEKSFYNSNNDAMLLSYNGLSHFSSADKNYIKDFMGNLGYTKNYDFWAFYDKGASYAGDSLLGMKYYLCGGIEEVFNEVEKINDITIYENQFALSLGTVVNSEIKNVEFAEMSPFENQKKIYDALYGEDTGLYTFISDYTTSTQNLVWQKGIDNDNAYHKENDESPAKITIKYISPDNNPTYLFLDSGYTPGVNVSVNGMERGEYLTTYHQGIMPLGVFEEGSEVLIELDLHGAHAAFDNPLIATLDMKKLAVVSEKLKGQGWQVKEHKNNYIKTDVNAAENGVLFTTIPYNKNWSVKVDGNKVETYMTCDTLLAFDMPEGTHEIVMSYNSLDIIIGCICSIIGLIVFAVFSIIVYKRNKEIDDVVIN